MDTELSAVVREIAEKLSGRNLKLGVAESYVKLIKCLSEG